MFFIKFVTSKRTFAKLGLKGGDVIQKINGEKADGIAMVLGYMGDISKVKIIEVLRDGDVVKNKPDTEEHRLISITDVLNQARALNPKSGKQVVKANVIEMRDESGKVYKMELKAINSKNVRKVCIDNKSLCTKKELQDLESN